MPKLMGELVSDGVPIVEQTYLVVGNEGQPGVTWRDSRAARSPAEKQSKIVVCAGARLYALVMMLM
jgi:hypothetical protein